jgi:hypothetical protein
LLKSNPNGEEEPILYPATFSTERFLNRDVVVSTHIVRDNQLGDFDPRPNIILDPFDVLTEEDTVSITLSDANINQNQNSNSGNATIANNSKSKESNVTNNDTANSVQNLIRTGGKQVTSMSLFVLIVIVGGYIALTRLDSKKR